MPYTERVEHLFNLCREKNFLITTAESCTGGLIAKTLTDIAGASDVFQAGFITYANAAKIAQLGVDDLLLEEYGAVSEQVAIAMAKGAIFASKANIAISTTGIAGPTGGSELKPVGTVYIGLAEYGKPAMAKQFLFAGNRADIREAATSAAIDMLLGRVDNTIA